MIYTHTLYRGATPNSDLYIYSLSWSHAYSIFMHIFLIVKSRLIVIYAHTLYHEAMPNRDLYPYSYRETKPNLDLFTYSLS